MEGVLDQPTKQDEQEQQLLVQFEHISGYVEDLSSNQFHGSMWGRMEVRGKGRLKYGPKAYPWGGGLEGAD